MQLTTDSKKIEVIATFPLRSVLGSNFVRLKVETIAEAREKMIEQYGELWAFFYQSEDAAGVDRWHLKEVPFGTPNMVREDCK